MKYQNNFKIILSVSIIVIVMMITGGCQSQEDNTAIATRTPIRTDLIKEGKIKVKDKGNKDEETKEDSIPESVQPSETIQQPEEADTAVTNSDAYNENPQQQNINRYIINTNTKLFHDPSCEKVSYIAPHNYSEFNGARDELINQGYSACYTCNP